MCTSTPKPRPRWFAPSSIPPILLLTFVTSFAFNHALISTQRKQDVRDHRIRTALLEETVSFNTRLLAHVNPPASSWSHSSTSILSRLPIIGRRGSGSSKTKADEEQASEPEWIAEERAGLLRRWRALGIDPITARLLPRSQNAPATIETTSASDDADAARLVTRHGPQEVTWTEIFFGSKQNRSSLTDRWHKVTAGIRDSFTNLTPYAQQAPGQMEAMGASLSEEEELAQLSQMWSSYSKQ